MRNFIYILAIGLSFGAPVEAQTGGSIAAAKKRVTDLEAALHEAKVDLARAQGMGSSKSGEPLDMSALGADTMGSEDPIASESLGGPLDALSKKVRDMKLSVRSGALDSSAVKKPASVQMTFPNDGEDSYSIDAGVTWNLTEFLGAEPIGTDFMSLEYSLLAEYHRNTLVQKEKDTFAAGALFSGVIGDQTESRWTHLIDAKLVYKTDRISEGEGYLGELFYWPLIDRPQGTSGMFPNIGGVFGPDWMQMVLQPGVGIQFEGTDNVDASGLEGDTIRAKAAVEFAVYPFANSFRRSMSDAESSSSDQERGRLELTAGYYYWNNFEASKGFALREDEHELFKASLNYYFGPWDEDSETRPFAFGLDYVNGENPEEGLQEQDYWQFAFKVTY